MLLFPLLLVSAHAEEPDWNTFSTGEWVDEGSKNSSVGPVHIKSRRVNNATCVTGEATVDVSAAKLTALTRDMESAIDWSSSDLAVSEVLTRASADSYVIYQYFDTPGWTFASDRYWVIRAQVTESAGTGRYVWTREDPSASWPDTAAAAKARSSSVVEPPVNYGDWRFTDGDGGTSVLYRTCADFGGSLPSSVTGWLTASQVPALFADLVTEAKKR